MPIPLKQRFFEKVNKNGPVHPILGTRCWIWIGGKKNKLGYGTIYVRKGETDEAHRVAYRNMVEPIPDGMCVCHKCDNPSCVNPDHLFLGTHQDNMKDMYRKGRNVPSIGEKNWRAKLTEENIREIWKRYKKHSRYGSGTASTLAREFKISLPSIYSVISRGWKHVK